MAAEPTGTFLTLDDGRPAVRFTRAYDHPADRVWRFVTDPDELAFWFPSRAEIDPRPGGTVAFSGDPAPEDSTGRVLAFDAPRRLAFTWGDDELRFDLGEAANERTRLTLTHVLGAEDTAARSAAGWDVCLAALDARARGERSGGPRPGARAQWRELYAAYVASGVPSGAPVPGTDA
ncbi:SRPBCC family protein [Streptomyces fungicidicus]|uniref:SRPBCC family protein n=1 Tax=Streptomyces fungicidicus TaxID=68203 RepID=UPI0033EC9963